MNQYTTELLQIRAAWFADTSNRYVFQSNQFEVVEAALNGNYPPEYAGQTDPRSVAIVDYMIKSNIPVDWEALSANQAALHLIVDELLTTLAEPWKCRVHFKYLSGMPHPLAVRLIQFELAHPWFCRPYPDSAVRYSSSSKANPVHSKCADCRHQHVCFAYLSANPMATQMVMLHQDMYMVESYFLMNPNLSALAVIQSWINDRHILHIPFHNRLSSNVGARDMLLSAMQHPTLVEVIDMARICANPAMADIVRALPKSELQPSVAENPALLDIIPINTRMLKYNRRTFHTNLAHYPPLDVFNLLSSFFSMRDWHSDAQTKLLYLIQFERIRRLAEQIAPRMDVYGIERAFERSGLVQQLQQFRDARIMRNRVAHMAVRFDGDIWPTSESAEDHIVRLHHYEYLIKVVSQQCGVNHRQYARRIQLIGQRLTPNVMAAAINADQRAFSVANVYTFGDLLRRRNQLAHVA